MGASQSALFCHRPIIPAHTPYFGYGVVKIVFMSTESEEEYHLQTDRAEISQVPRGLARRVGSASAGFSGQTWRG